MDLPLPPFLQSVVQVLDTLNCGAAVIDRAGTILFVNQRLRAMTGFACDQLIGKSVLSIHPGHAEQAQLRDMLDHFADSREAELQLPRADGGTLPVVTSSRPLGADPPADAYRVATMIDVSRLKEVETDLKEQYAFISQLSDTILKQAIDLKRQAEQLEQRVEQRTRELHEANMDAVFMLAVASEAKDADTGAHVQRLRKLTEKIAQEMGLPPAQVRQIGYASVLHDVGKIHVPDRILSKPGPLDPSEREEMKQHTLAGERILSNRPFFEPARRIARWHHEDWSGSGYPDGLAREAIPIEARIVHVADVFDALTNQRVYKPAWSTEKAAQFIREQAGGMFDPAVVRAFLQVLNGEPVRPHSSAGNQAENGAV
jgi:putative two-component system response regulator